MTIHHFPGPYTPHVVQVRRPEPAPRHWYMDSLPIQIGGGAIIVLTFSGLLVWGFAVALVDLVMGHARTPDRTVSHHHWRG